MLGDEYLGIVSHTKFSGFGDGPIPVQLAVSLFAGGSGDLESTQDYIAQLLSNSGWTLLAPIAGQFSGNNFLFTVTVNSGGDSVDTVQSKIKGTFQNQGLTVNEIKLLSPIQNTPSSNKDFLTQIGEYLGFSNPTSSLAQLGIGAAAGGALVLVLGLVVLSRRD